MRPRMIACMLFLAPLIPSLLSCGPKADPRLSGSWRGEEVNGWVPVRAQGAPPEQRV